MGLFLTNIEMQELTGYLLPTKQVGWLLNHGYFVETNSRGMPRITYSQVEDMRRNNTPMHLTTLNNTQNIDRTTNQMHTHQTKYFNNQQQMVASEPNMHNLMNKIKNLNMNKVSSNG